MNITMTYETFQKILNFLILFELVFNSDWDHTLDCINGNSTINPNGYSTFINPKVEDEYNDWHNRGALLEQYRELYKELGLDKPINRIGIL